MYQKDQASKRQLWASVWSLSILAVICYAPLIGWGVPHATAPDRVKTFATDEILPLEGLAEMHNTFVVSKPDRNYGYPWWHYFVVSVAQSPYLAYLYFNGQLQSGAPAYPFGLRDPVAALRHLTLIGRAVSVVMAAGIVLATYFFASFLLGQWCGVLTALLTMTNYLMFYYSRTGNLDVPAAFWSSVGLAIFARIVVDGLTIRRMVWLGIFAGLAMATKDQSLMVFLPVGCLLLWPRFIRASRVHWQVLLIGLAVALIAYALGTGMLVDPQRHITHVRALLFHRKLVSSADFYWPPRPRTWGGTGTLILDYFRGLTRVFSIPLVLTAAAGLLIELRSSSRRLAFLLPLPLLFLMLYRPAGVVVLRYMLPLVLIVSLFAAIAILALRRSRLRPLWIPLAGLIVGWQMLVGMDLSYAQYHETRYAAAAWLARTAIDSDRVEYFGAAETMPYLAAGINSRPVAGRTEWVGEFDHGPRVMQYLAREGPEFVVVVPDWTSKPGMERSEDCPAEVYEALSNGSINYGLAAYFPSLSLFDDRRLRPVLDNPSVSPPVRIFARQDVLDRIRSSANGEAPHLQHP